jgi:hypothetical protein
MYLVLIIVAILILILLFQRGGENFDTIAEKDAANREWFSKSANDNYEAYREQVPGSDVVDYTNYKKKLR